MWRFDVYNRIQIWDTYKIIWKKILIKQCKYEICIKQCESEILIK